LKNFPELFGDEIRLRERERAAARGDYNWPFSPHFQTELTEFTELKK
jgi:hypothetical protein